jgi:HemY protein
MLRILFFLIVVFALGLGFAWLADRPGDLVMTFGGYQYQVSLMVAAVLVTALVATIMISWWLIKSIWNTPHAVSRYFRVRRRDRGYQALSTGMIAAGAGDAGLARRKKREAMKLISADQEPLIHLLDAQASLLEGDHEAARAKFTAMLDDPETRQLGLRGLFLEAERLGDRAAARHYAQQASSEAPQLGWALEATLEKRTEEGEWDEALRLVDAQKSTRQLDREAAHRRKAVLLTAKAITNLEADPTGAKTAALEAVRLAPDLVPASVTAARAAFRLGDTRKGAKVLEAIWKRQAHPEVADAYVHARHGDSTHDRLARARKLRSMRQNNAEAEMAVARAALDAGEYKEAREAARAALRLEPREGAFLLMADIEEADTNDQGMVREWLSRAVRAPRDPVWVADGYVSERWAPISPVTGRLDAFEWRPPAERPGQVIEEYKEPKPRPVAAVAAPVQVPPAADDKTDLVIEALPQEDVAPKPPKVETPAPQTQQPTPPDTAQAKPPQPQAKPEAAPAAVTEPKAAAAPAPAAPVVTTAPATPAANDTAPPAGSAASQKAATPPAAETLREPAKTPAEARSAPIAPPPVATAPSQASPSLSAPAPKPPASNGRAGDGVRGAKAPEPAGLPRMPDDPGVDDDDEAREAGPGSRFRLF